MLSNLWDAGTGEAIRSFKAPDQGGRDLAFAPNGLTAVSGNLRLWDVATGDLLRALENRGEGHGNVVSSVAFTPDGRTILTGSWDGTVKLWDVETGKVTGTFKGHSGPVNSVAFSPDGLTALSGSGDGTMKLWDVGAGG
jgi:WD40 repeat protein